MLSFFERFKKTYDEIEGISQDTIITCFEGEFRLWMLYTELQLRKPETIREIFNVAHQIALAEGSAQDTHYKKKERFPDQHRDKLKVSLINKEESNSEDQIFHSFEYSQRKPCFCHKGEVWSSRSYPNENLDSTNQR